MSLNDKRIIPDLMKNVLDNKIASIKESSFENRTILSEQNNTLNSLLKRFENSSKKGKMSENLLSNVLAEVYPLAEIEDVGKTKETGDIMMLRKNKPKILVENMTMFFNCYIYIFVNS